jgi:aminoglycoside phosphotransferase family enzyme
MTLDELVAAFRQGRVLAPAGPVRPESVRITRQSVLVTTRATVLKLRRPRVAGGWDQASDAVRTTLAQRERVLGSRIAPHVYLGPVQLVGRDDGTIALEASTGSDADTGEPVVAMNRLPDDRRADQVLVTSEPPRDAFAAVAMAIARYHDNAAAHWGDDGPGRPERAFEAWTTALERLHHAPELPATGAELARLDADTRDLLTHIARPLAHRVIEGRMREGHGGLALEHIFLTDPPGFIDPGDATGDTCFVDTAEDLARFALELAAVTPLAFAERVIDTYATAARDLTLRRVLPFYMRLAAVRAAHDALDEARDPDGIADPAECREAARFFVTQATRESSRLSI